MTVKINISDEELMDKARKALSWRPPVMLDEQHEAAMNKAVEILDRIAVPVKPLENPDYYKTKRPNDHFPTCSCKECRDPGLDGLHGWERTLFSYTRKNVFISPAD